MNRFLALFIFLNLLFLTSFANATEHNNETKLPAHSQVSTYYAPPAQKFNHFPTANSYPYRTDIHAPDTYDYNYSYEQPPTQVIKDTLQKITTFTTHAGNVSPVELRRFIENEIIPHFDFNSMSRWITGPYARYMSTQEKNNFQKQLRETLLSSLAKHLGSFDAEDTRIRFAPVQYRGQNEAFVRTFIYRPQQPPVRLNFRMRNTGNNWKIIDIRANGASAVLYYRNHFMSQLRRYRGNY